MKDKVEFFTNSNSINGVEIILNKKGGLLLNTQYGWAINLDKTRIFELPKLVKDKGNGEEHIDKQKRE